MRLEEVLLAGGRTVVAPDHLRFERLSERDLARVGAGEGRRDLACYAIAQPPRFLWADAGQVVRKKPAAYTPCHADGRWRRRGGPVEPAIDVQLLVDRGAIRALWGRLGDESGLHRGQDL